jgi:hypothetical protein
VIVAIGDDASSDNLRIVYNSVAPGDAEETDEDDLTGEVQIIPGCAQLSVQVGDTVKAGDVIGDIVPRAGVTSWEILQSLIPAEHLGELQSAFLRSVAMTPDDWYGDGYLLPAQLVKQHVDKALSTDGEIHWYCDFSRSMDYLDSGSGGILSPPMDFPDWNTTEFMLGGVSCVVGNQSQQPAVKKFKRKETTANA